MQLWATLAYRDSLVMPTLSLRWLAVMPYYIINHVKQDECIVVVHIKAGVHYEASFIFTKPHMTNAGALKPIIRKTRA